MADDIYSLLMEKDEPTATQKAAALAQALRGQRGAAGLALLTGDKVLGNFGQALLQGAGQGEGRLAEAGALRSGNLTRMSLAEAAARRAKDQAAAADSRRKEDRAWQEGRDAKRFANEREVATIAAGNKARQEREARTRGTVIPGLEVAPGAEPTADDAKKVKASMAARERMLANVAELKGLYEKHGTELVGPVASRMKQLSTAIKLEGKTLAELGALSGPDEALMNAIAGDDPTSARAAIKGLFGLDSTAQDLEGVKTWTDRQADANLKTYGYQPDVDLDAPEPTVAQPQPKSALPAARGMRTEPPKAPTVPAGKVRVTDGKETLVIDAADVAEAEKDGFRRVP